MALVFKYMFSRILSRITLFFEHWYMGGLVISLGMAGVLFRQLEGTFAVVVTARNFFKPLFQDRTFIGYILGFIFRSFRILIGAVVYVVVFAVAAFLYLAWASIPVYSILKLIHELVSS